MLTWAEIQDLVYLKKADPKEYEQSLKEMEDVLYDIAKVTIRTMEKLRKEQIEEMKKTTDKG